MDDIRKAAAEREEAAKIAAAEKKEAGVEEEADTVATIRATQNEMIDRAGDVEQGGKNGVGRGKPLVGSEKLRDSIPDQLEGFTAPDHLHYPEARKPLIRYEMAARRLAEREGELFAALGEFKRRHVIWTSPGSGGQIYTLEGKQKPVVYIGLIPPGHPSLSEQKHIVKSLNEKSAVMIRPDIDSDAIAEVVMAFALTILATNPNDRITFQGVPVDDMSTQFALGYRSEVMVVDSMSDGKFLKFIERLMKDLDIKTIDDVNSLVSRIGDKNPKSSWLRHKMIDLEEFVFGKRTNNWFEDTIRITTMINAMAYLIAKRESTSLQGELKILADFAGKMQAKQGIG